uniref:Uncharacterized protein n=1 Tax=Streptomyces avermitilis TaxID=33903 RepID=A0A499W6N0_STRAX|nr:hypothetical protein SAVMC3_84450 [Streptomyces avermitilis]
MRRRDLHGASDGSWSRDDGGATPEEGLQAYFDLEQAEDPHYGYRVEREERDRVLYSFDVHGRTKVAVVVAKDQKGGPVGVRSRARPATRPNFRRASRTPSPTRSGPTGTAVAWQRRW